MRRIRCSPPGRARARETLVARPDGDGLRFDIASRARARRHSSPYDGVRRRSSSRRAIRESVSGDAWLRSFLASRARSHAQVPKWGSCRRGRRTAIVELCARPSSTGTSCSSVAGRSGTPSSRSSVASAGRVGGDERYVHLGRDEPGRARYGVDARGTRCDRAGVRRARAGRHGLRRARAERTARRRLRRERCSSRRCRRLSGWWPRAGSWRCSMRKDELARARAGYECSLAARRGRWPRLGDRGLRVVELVASRPGAAPSPCFPGTRTASASRPSEPHWRRAAGVCGKVAQDVVLLAQTEVGEVREAERWRLVGDAAEAQSGPRGAGPSRCAGGRRVTHQSCRRRSSRSTVEPREHGSRSGGR